MQRVRCKENFIICTAIEEDAGTEGSKEDATTCLCATACAPWSSYAVCTSVCSSFPSSMVPDDGSSGKRAWSWLALSLSLSLDWQQIGLFFSLPLPLLISAAIEPCITQIQRVHLNSGFPAALLREQGLSLISKFFEMELNGS
jgi:hypothetical protein